MPTMLIIYALVALGISFFCSLAEAALLSVTPSYVVALRDKGKWTGRVLDGVKSEIDRSLAAILSLNTIAHTVGAVGVGAEATARFNISTGVASAILTILILVLSEIIPKTLGAVYWRFLAPLMAVLVKSWIFLLYPVVWISEQLTKLLSKGEKTHSVSREEFQAMANIGAEEGLLELEESRILQNLLRFHSLKVKEIMTPRTVVFMIDRSAQVDEVLEKYPDIPFSRIPVYEGSPDTVTGFVLKHDILLAQARSRGSATMAEFERPLAAMPETATLHALFEELLDKRAHILLVVDEYGGMEGIVTLEDLVETMLGLEIVDEADRTVDMQALARAKRERLAQRMNLPVEELYEEEGNGGSG